MVEVVTAAAQETKREFIGRAWMNKAKKDGREYINIRFDKGVKVTNLDENCQMQLWPNTKREGKKDADLRLSILVPMTA
jgi:uncharacterized protein (DUF736 family)